MLYFYGKLSLKRGNYLVKLAEEDARVVSRGGEGGWDVVTMLFRAPWTPYLLLMLPDIPKFILEVPVVMLEVPNWVEFVPFLHFKIRTWARVAAALRHPKPLLLLHFHSLRALFLLLIVPETVN
jgi:hypothetical protein